MPAMLDADLELAQRMATTLRKFIEVLGVESKLGKSRLAEMTAMFEVEEGRESSQEWCAEGESHGTSWPRAGASGEAA